MRIIKEGKKDKDIIFEGNCIHCECKFECNTTELINPPSLRFFGYNVIKCPNCKETIVVKKK